MSNRLSKIYTKTGDDGTTGLGDGSRISKLSPRVEAMGTVDELNCVLGQLIAWVQTDSVKPQLTRIQHELFDLGAELCIPGSNQIGDAQINHLEQDLDTINDTLPPLKEFILPGGSHAVATCHLARAVCRRAERRLLSLTEIEPGNSGPIRYLNRLSDLLFVFAREISRSEGVPEVYWQSEISR
ncbi:MAG TPA: cob(I)yrinic acid a,c-diamide adenosyltransferase [Chromatiaceae bacterium]|nr:cob(I)yrinic acid a,c-diamide adenosyltransferase [Chromatiaceae bacterium]